MFRPVMFCSLLLVLLTAPAVAQDTLSPPLGYAQQREAPVQSINPASWSWEMPELAAAAEAQRWAQLLTNATPLSVSLAGLPNQRLGDRSEAVASLRQALRERGFVTEGQATPLDPFVFDVSLDTAVREAQRYYNQAENGVAGPGLYASLAWSDREMGTGLAALATDLQWHADRARRAGYAKLLVVNVPSFTLKAIDLTTGQTALETRVIVGKPSRQTPLFTTNIVNLKYNPDWTPPPSLARQGKRYVPAGPNNPLGRIRFSTDNNQNIYLHHTNEPGLFDRQNRALSSGCVRVDAWDDLAAFVASSSIEHIHAQVETRRTTFEKVETVPVVILYSTVDVVNGQPARFSDIYSKGARPLNR